MQQWQRTSHCNECTTHSTVALAVVNRRADWRLSELWLSEVWTRKGSSHEMWCVDEDTAACRRVTGI